MIASSLDSTMAAKWRASRSSRRRSVMSRAIFETPIDLAIRRHDRRDRQRDVDALAILANADCFVMVDAFAGANPAQDVVLFLVELRRNDQADRLPDRLSLGVPEDPLGRPIPGGDRPGEVLADDGVVGRCHDARKPEMGDVVGL